MAGIINHRVPDRLILNQSLCPHDGYDHRFIDGWFVVGVFEIFVRSHDIFQ